MKGQRFFALLLVLNIAAALAYASRNVFMPGMLVAVGLVGLFGRWHWEMRNSRRVILFLLVTLAFAAKYRLTTPVEEMRMERFFGHPQWTPQTEWLLGLIVVHFFLKPRKAILNAIPFAGLLAVFTTGLIYERYEAGVMFRIFAISYIGLMIFYYNSLREPMGTVSAGDFGRRQAVLLLLLSIALAGGWLIGTRWTSNQLEVESLLNRLEAPNLIQRMFQEERGTVEFSSEVRLESIKRIHQRGGKKVALHVFSKSTPGYLRAAAFETFENSRWNTDAEVQILEPAETAVEHLELPYDSAVFVPYAADSRQWQTLDIWPSTRLSAGMLAPLGTAVFQAPVESILHYENDAYDSPDLYSGVNYVAAVPQRPVSRPPGQEYLQRCLQLPEDIDGRIEQLAEELFRDCRPGTAGKIAAVVSYFNANYTYHLGVKVPRHQDPLTYFLLEKPAAHCEYFAAGAAILLRLGEVPCRYVTGFVAAERNPYLEDGWLARNQDAHAWVEAWDAGQKQWILVEATVAGGVPEGDKGSQAGYLWDSINYQLQNLRVALYLEGVKGVFRWIGGRLADLVTSWIGWLLILLLALPAGYRWWRKYQRYRRSLPADRQVRTLQRLLGRMDRRIRRQGLVRQPAETLEKFARRIEQKNPQEPALVRAAQWYRDYARCRYRPRNSGQELQVLEEMIRKGQ